MQRIKKTSMQDIADYVGVSKNCVSLALNHKRGVSDELRARIHEAARELNYAGLKDMESKTAQKNILVLASEYVIADRLFYPEFIWGIEREARSHGYNVVITGISFDMEELLVLPNTSGMDLEGIIVIGVLSREYIRKLQDTQKQVVLVDAYYIDMECNAVVTQNVHGAYTAVQHLITNGHRDIGYIGPIHLTSSNYERWVGFQRAMMDNGLPIVDAWNLTTSAELSCTNEELDVFVRGLETLPTAWFCANDRMAISLIHVLRELNLRVPDDISIVGFDDAEPASIVMPKLTTVRVKREILCREAVELLLTSTGDRTTHTKIAVYGELVLRDSVKTKHSENLSNEASPEMSHLQL